MLCENCPYADEDEVDVGKPLSSSSVQPSIGDRNGPLDSTSGDLSATSAATPARATASARASEQADGREEGEADESIVMQMEEVDEHGQSHMRNVSLEELVDSGHILMADGGAL